MERKKSPKADLENKKGIFFEIGLALALGILLFAFEWTSSTAEVDQFEMVADEEVEEEIIPITQQLLKPPPPPPPPPPVLSELFEIVEDDVDIDEELEIIDAEDESENEEVQDLSEFEDFGEESTGETEVFFVVENMPVFPGGNIQAWIAKNIEYPTIALENGIQGRVFVKFVIETTGKIGAVEVLRGVDPALDKEAIRVIKSMPAWKPGKQRGKPVRVSIQIPINFQLN